MADKEGQGELKTFKISAVDRLLGVKRPYLIEWQGKRAYFLLAELSKEPGC
ncbi:MAG TPA: hypothetical protein HA306_10745 [Methanosarcina sp.]|nr:hypothetical protein [Methanosarcina sp.]